VVVPQAGNPGRGGRGLRGRKIAIGPPGSGTRALSLELIKRNGMERQVGELLALAPREAAEKLEAGEIDVALMMSSWDAPVVQELLADERVALSGFPHADAVIALYPFLTKVTVPRGVTDLPRDQPPADVTLIATKTSLVVRGTYIRPFSTCCSTLRARSIRDRAFSITPTHFPPPRRSTCR
jgi:TRAP-type uncharacterized transport system substrate-binding protein